MARDLWRRGEGVFLGSRGRSQQALVRKVMKVVEAFRS